jgi:hypothetical protein
MVTPSVKKARLEQKLKALDAKRSLVEKRIAELDAAEPKAKKATKRTR